MCVGLLWSYSATLPSVRQCLCSHYPATYCYTFPSSFCATQRPSQKHRLYWVVSLDFSELFLVGSIEREKEGDSNLPQIFRHNSPSKFHGVNITSCYTRSEQMLAAAYWQAVFLISLCNVWPAHGVSNFCASISASMLKILTILSSFMIEISVLIEAQSVSAIVLMSGNNFVVSVFHSRRN